MCYCEVLPSGYRATCPIQAAIPLRNALCLVPGVDDRTLEKAIQMEKSRIRFLPEVKCAVCQNVLYLVKELTVSGSLLRRIFVCRVVYT